MKNADVQNGNLSQSLGVKFHEESILWKLIGEKSQGHGAGEQRQQPQVHSQVIYI